MSEYYSHLHKVLATGQFAVTAECGPPRGANRETVLQKGEFLKKTVDAVNITDNQTAIMRMSSIAAGRILLDEGIEPVIQMVTRDRNRIALQSDLLGAYALGIRNVVCLTGDHQNFGSHPEASNVFDVDSINLIHTIREMRERGTDLSGKELDVAPKMFIGAAANPFADPFEYRVIRLAKKVAAGADFIQTQCIYNIDKFKEWMKAVNDQGLSEKTYILAGVTPLKSARMAKFMNDNVAGMDIPEDVIKRMESVPKEEGVQEGLKICAETIDQLKELEGVKGVHVMAIEWEKKVPQIVESAGLMPRPQKD